MCLVYEGGTSLSVACVQFGGQRPSILKGSRESHLLVCPGGKGSGFYERESVSATSFNSLFTFHTQRHNPPSPPMPLRSEESGKDSLFLALDPNAALLKGMTSVC